jgi:hypothetical protein
MTDSKPAEDSAPVDDKPQRTLTDVLTEIINHLE